MQILHVTHQYRPAIGGAEQYIVDLSEQLAARGHQVTVMTGRSRNYQSWRNELPSSEALDGVEVRRFRCVRRGPATWRLLRYGYDRYFLSHRRCYQPLIWWGNGPVLPGLGWALLREAARFDLVHINNLHYAHAALTYGVARQRGLPVVITPHIHTEQPLTFDVGYMWDVLRGSDHILADTEAEREFLIENGIDHQRITSVGIGIRLEKFPALDQRSCRRDLGLPEDGFIVLFLGRKEEYKGLDMLLEAFAMLRPELPAIHLVAAGTETDHSRALWSRYEELGNMYRWDSVGHSVRLPLLNACNCLVVPSKGEAFGIVYVEAWAVARPVIGAHTRAVSSLISEGKDGFLVTPGSTAVLADQIARLARDGDLARKMGEQGREKVWRRYSLSRTAEIVEGVYRRVLRRRASYSRSTVPSGG